MPDPDDGPVLATMHPENMNPAELAAFVQALSAMKGIRAHISDGALVWTRRRPGSTVKAADDG